MQLKVCNPRLGFLISVSLDEESDEMLRSDDRCKFIMGFKSPRDSRLHFIVVEKLKTKKERK